MPKAHSKGTHSFIDAVVSSTLSGAFIVDDVCRVIGVDDDAGAACGNPAPAVS
jgi:hypothetical protein